MKRHRDLTRMIHDAYYVGDTTRADRLVKERETVTTGLFGKDIYAGSKGRSYRS